jgi:hypothetical protein
MGVSKKNGGANKPITQQHPFSHGRASKYLLHDKSKIRSRIISCSVAVARVLLRNVKHRFSSGLFRRTRKMVSPDHCRAVDVAAIELWRVGRFMIVPRWWWGRAGAAAWVVGLGCRLGLSWHPSGPRGGRLLGRGQASSPSAPSDQAGPRRIMIWPE